MPTSYVCIGKVHSVVEFTPDDRPGTCYRSVKVVQEGGMASIQITPDLVAPMSSLKGQSLRFEGEIDFAAKSPKLIYGTHTAATPPKKP